MIKKYNISKPENYTKNGVEKTYWASIGTLTEFTKEDGSKSTIVEIPAISLKANVFPQGKKEDDNPQKVAQAEELGQQDDIKAEDLPF